MTPLRHLALIPDGNRRWAHNRGLSSAEGHREGFLTVAPKLIETAWGLDIEVLTFWMFSAENWRRSSVEINNLMKIYQDFLVELSLHVHRFGVRVCHAGRRDRLPRELIFFVDRLVAETAVFHRRVLVLGLDFGGVDGLVSSIRRLLADPSVSSKMNDVELLASLEPATAGCPPLDVVLRTSGESRLSGFMPLESAYAELFFLDKYFPEMTSNDLCEVVTAFRNRERRFGS